MNKIITSLSVALLLAACKPADKAPATEPSTAAAVTPDEYLTFQREPLAPRAQYVPINISDNHRVSGEANMERENNLYRSLFWSGAKVDYAALAYDFLPGYRREKDAFNRTAIINTNKATLDKAYQDARKNNKFALLMEGAGNVQISAYDPVKKGYTVNVSVSGEHHTSWSKPNEGEEHPAQAWGIALLGAETGYGIAYEYAAPDEAAARVLEARLSKLRKGSDNVSLPGLYFGRVVRANTKPSYNDQHVAYVLIDAIGVKDPNNGDLLFTLDLSKSYKEVKITNSNVRRALDKIE